MAQPPSTNSAPITTTSKSPDQCEEGHKKDAPSPSSSTKPTSPSSAPISSVVVTSAAPTKTTTTIICPWTGLTLLKPIQKE